MSSSKRVSVGRVFGGRGRGGGFRWVCLCLCVRGVEIVDYVKPMNKSVVSNSI